MHLGRSQFGTASGISGVEGNYESVVCQICFKSGHTAAECWHRYIENYVPQQTRSYSKDRNSDSMSLPGAAYVANCEGAADEG